MDNQNGQKKQKLFLRLKQFLVWFISIAFLGAWAIFIIRVYTGGNEDLFKFFQLHYTFFIGLPVAGIFAFFLVVVLELQQGPIKIQIGALKVEGAGSALLFWVVIFWTMVLSIKLLWW
jgi:hypothetical protein